MPVTAISTDGKQLISSSKDGKIAIIQIGAGGVYKMDKVIDLSMIQAVKGLPKGHAISMDLFKGNMLVGLRNGTILEIKDKQEPRVITESHFEGEAWGLHVLDDNHVITTGDDNRIMLFDISEKKYLRDGMISDKKARKDPSKKSIAATDSH